MSNIWFNFLIRSHRHSPLEKWEWRLNIPLKSMVSCANLLVSALRIKRKYYFLIDLHKRSARSRFLFLIHILDVKTVRIVPYQKTYHQFINIKIYRSEAEMPIKRSPVYLCDENVFQLSFDFICRPSLHPHSPGVHQSATGKEECSKEHTISQFLTATVNACIHISHAARVQSIISIY